MVLVVIGTENARWEARKSQRNLHYRTSILQGNLLRSAIHWVKGHESRFTDLKTTKITGSEILEAPHTRTLPHTALKFARFSDVPIGCNRETLISLVLVRAGTRWI